MLWEQLFRGNQEHQHKLPSSLLEPVLDFQNDILLRVPEDLPVYVAEFVNFKWDIHDKIFDNPYLLFQYLISN